MTDLLFPCGCFGPTFGETTEIPHSSVQDYDAASTKLFKAIEIQKWGTTACILETNPKEASIWVKHQGYGGFWRLPIHEACMHQPTEAIIAALIKAHPSGVREKDSDGQLPIHHACANGASYGVIYRLLLACPDSLDVRNNWGNLPIDIATSDPSTADEIIQALKKRPSYYAVESYRDSMKEMKLELNRVRTENKHLTEENQVRRAKEIQLVKRNSFHVQKEEKLLKLLQTNMKE